MWQILDFCIRQPVAALIASLRMVGEDVPLAMKIDAMISRATNILGRAATGRMQGGDASAARKVWQK